MIGSTPQFPAFDRWQQMSESEQDAFIAGLEAARRRNSLICIGLVCAILGAAIVAAFYALGWH